MGCGNKDNWQPMPKDDPYVRNEIMPMLIGLEDSLEKRVVSLVAQHPIWDWAKGVKGIGPTTMARVIAHCNIEKCTTLSKFWAHFGHGLRKDGTVQRKKRGETLDYDSRAQSIAFVMGTSLQMQQDKYYEFYLDWKKEYLSKGLSDGLANSRAFRNERKLCLSHIYEIWRKGVGLSYEEPYAFTVMTNPHALSHKISPWDMVRKPATNR